jgi:hypothetical protein
MDDCNKTSPLAVSPRVARLVEEHFFSPLERQLVVLIGKRQPVHLAVILQHLKQVEDSAIIGVLLTNLVERGVVVVCEAGYLVTDPEFIDLAERPAAKGSDGKASACHASHR